MEAHEFELMKIKNSESLTLLLEKYTGIVSAIANWRVKDISVAEKLAQDVLENIWDNIPAFTNNKEAFIKWVVETTQRHCDTYNKLYSRTKLN